MFKANPLDPECFLPTEDPNAFLALLNEYAAQYQPQGREELDLLTEAVFAKWRLKRCWLAQTSQALRTEAQMHRQYRNCLKDLRSLQASRPPEEPVQTAPADEPKPVTTEEIGSIAPEQMRTLYLRAEIRRFLDSREQQRVMSSGEPFQ